MKKTISFLSLLLLIALFTACNENSQKKVIKTEPIAFTKEGVLWLKDSAGNTITELEIEIADDSYERDTGLMHRQDMEENQGMLFVYTDEKTRHFWMKNTYIPLDIIYFDSDSTAVSFQENASPMDETSLQGGPAQFVLEVNAGLIEKWNIEIGDSFDFQRQD